MPAARLAALLVAGAAALSGLAAAGVHLVSEGRLRDVPTVAPFATPIPADSASIARGEHLARTRGCVSCHGDQLQGRDFSEDWPDAGTTVAPNLAKLARAKDAATFERALRHGIGRDGRALWSMPAYNFVRLRDEDVAALIAFLRARPVVEIPLPEPRLSWAIRWDLAARGGTHMPEWVREVPPLEIDPSADSLRAEGEYLAMTACNECHGLDLRGSTDGPPDLAIVAGYTVEELTHLLRTGVARDGRSELGLMGSVARNRYVHLRDEEVSALHAYLGSLAGRPVPEGVFWRGAP